MVVQEEVRLAVAFALWREARKTGRTQRQGQVLFGEDGACARDLGEHSEAENEAQERVDSLQRDLAIEKERSQKLQGELEKQLREKGKARSALEEIRLATGSSLVDENASLKAELRKWKNIARHINVELIEHDKEVLKIMHLTGSTRLAWERDLALNRQGLFASKLNEQEKAVKEAVESTRKELSLQFDEDIAQERKSREKAETELSGLKNKSAYFEEMFRDAHKVNKTLAETHAELLEELERERRESAASTPKKVRQHAEKMRKRNRELHTELEDLRVTSYEMERQMKDLSFRLEQKERELADQEKYIRERNANCASASTQTNSVVFGDEERIKKEKEKRERLIKAYEQKIEKQASQLEKQKAQIDKQKSKTEKKLRKASKCIASLREKQAVKRFFFAWKSEMFKEQSLREYKQESLERRKQWKSKHVITYFSMYHHKRHNKNLLKHFFLRWKILTNTMYSKWLSVLHKAFRRIQRAEARTLNARLQLSHGWTITKALVAHKFPVFSRRPELRYFTTTSVTLKRLMFGIWKFQTIQRKLVRDRKGLKLAISFLDRHRREKEIKFMLKGWKKACTDTKRSPAVGAAAEVMQNLAQRKEDETKEVDREANEVTFVDKTLGMKIDSDVIIKYTKDGSALQSILDKVQAILHNELKELQNTISKEVHQMTSSRSRSTLASKQKIQKRLLHVDMTCGKLLEGLLLMQQTLEGSQPRQAFQTNLWGGSADPERASHDLEQVMEDLRAIKAQAHQSLTSLEGLDRKMAVGHRVIKADLPKRITLLYNKHLQEHQDQKEKTEVKPPEWSSNLPVFLPID